MPTIKEQLDKTIKAAAVMFKQSAELTAIQASIRREDAKEAAAQRASTVGDTVPDEET